VRMGPAPLEIYGKSLFCPNLMGNKNKSYSDIKINLRSPKGDLSLMGPAPLEVNEQPVRGKRLLTGFTMIELLVVLIIIGILVSLNMGNFSRSSEKNKAKEAEANLQLIYTAQQRYYLGEGKYYNCTSPCDDISDSSNLGITLEGDNFNYTITTTTSPSFLATATRAGSGLACSGMNMTITNQNGTIQKDCPQW